MLELLSLSLQRRTASYATQTGSSFHHKFKKEEKRKKNRKIQL